MSKIFFQNNYVHTYTFFVRSFVRNRLSFCRSLAIYMYVLVCTSACTCHVIGLRSTYCFCYAIHILVPSSAQNVQTTRNNTHIMVTWSPPATPNGIVNYTVEIRETDLLTSQTTKELDAMVVTDLFYVLEYSVRPYSRYTVSVTSQTAAGMGETEMDSFDTPEEGD